MLHPRLPRAVPLARATQNLQQIQKFGLACPHSRNVAWHEAISSVRWDVGLLFCVCGKASHIRHLGGVRQDEVRFDASPALGGSQRTTGIRVRFGHVNGLRQRRHAKRARRRRAVALADEKKERKKKSNAVRCVRTRRERGHNDSATRR